MREKKGNEMFCMCCRCRGKNMHKPLEDPFKYCTKLTSDHFNPKCHHHKLDWVQIEQYKKQQVKEICEALQTELGSVVTTDCVFVHHDPTRADSGTTDRSSVNFIPTSLQEESFDLMLSLQYDLMLREIGIDGDLEELHVLLIEQLDMKHDLNELQFAIADCEPNADAFVDLAKLIPCALHLEMRMGLKMSTMILGEVLNGFLIKLDQVTFIEHI
jgi:hypothetical protein